MAPAGARVCHVHVRARGIFTRGLARATLVCSSLFAEYSGIMSEYGVGEHIDGRTVWAINKHAPDKTINFNWIKKVRDVRSARISEQNESVSTRSIYRLH